MKLSARVDALPTLELARLATWLVETGLAGGNVGQLVEGLCQRCNAAGLRVARVYVAMTTLHPLLRAYGYRWDRNIEGIEEVLFEHADERSEAWMRSPFQHMLTQRIDRMRRRLEGPDAVLDFPVLTEFRDLGFTDWYAAAFDFGSVTLTSELQQMGLICSFTTDRPGGFSETDLALLETIVPVLAVSAKGITSYQIARGLLGTYLGRDAADRVFLGQVKRGSVLSTEAVLFYADLRGFTQLADRLPRDELVEMLDEYLEVMAEAVEERGGHVLKFLGDGLLGTFGLGSQLRADVCQTALEAARGAQAGTAKLNEARAAQGRPGMELDLALHVGEVSYGNVGSARRLDFTVIGPAVNEASRIEALCKELGRSILVSEDFAAAASHSRGELISLGRHRLRGVAGDTELFAVRDRQASP